MAALVAAVTMVLLWLPSSYFPAHLLAGGVWPRAGHVLLFGTWAWAMGWLWGSEVRRGWVWLAVALVSGLGEWMQPVFGRSADWLDWGAGLAGAAWICLGLNRWGWLRQWGGLLLVALMPLGWGGTLAAQEARDFPLLIRPGTQWSRQGWTATGVRVSTRDGVLRLDRTIHGNGEGHIAYPGVFRRPVVSDWSEVEALDLRIYWPGPETATFAIRVDDQPGNPPYAERFQREFAATSGWNLIRVPVGELGWTSGGSPMDLGRIHQWGVFLVSKIPFDYFLLHTVQLDVPQEQP